MAMKQLSLHVVGANHSNADGSNRRFEILLCVPGEPIELLPEPKNPADPSAIAVVSARHIQIGYLTADRAPWIGSMLRNGRELQAVFQEATQPGAAIRIGFDGEVPVLPRCDRKRHAEVTTEEVDFWPDELPSDD